MTTPSSPRFRFRPRVERLENRLAPGSLLPLLDGAPVSSLDNPATEVLGTAFIAELTKARETARLDRSWEHQAGGSVQQVSSTAPDLRPDQPTSCGCRPSGPRQSASADAEAALLQSLSGIVPSESDPDAGLVRVAGAATAGPGLLPDLRTVVPQHLQLVNQQQRELLRFSNGIANTGDGPWRMRPRFPLTGTSGTQDAIQEVLDAQGNIVTERVVSQFQYHPAHHHWHIDGVALYEVRAGSPTGSVVGGNSVKTTFCLIDGYRLDGHSPSSARTYFDCFGDHQGISPGWVDEYHQSTPGQELDLTGVPAGRYYLVSTANFAGTFLERDLANNAAWVGFQLSRDSRGNPHIEVVDHSPCDTPGLCGEVHTDR